MKKQISALLATVIIVSMFACTDNTDAAAGTESEIAVESEVNTEGYTFEPPEKPERFIMNGQKVNTVPDLI